MFLWNFFTFSSQILIQEYVHDFILVTLQLYGTAVHLCFHPSFYIWNIFFNLFPIRFSCFDIKNMHWLKFWIRQKQSGSHGRHRARFFWSFPELLPQLVLRCVLRRAEPQNRGLLTLSDDTHGACRGPKWAGASKETLVPAWRCFYRLYLFGAIENGTLRELDFQKLPEVLRLSVDFHWVCKSD